METRWLSVRTAATYMDCKQATVRRWISEGAIPAARILHRNSTGRGRHICTLRIDKLALDAALLKRQA